MMFLQLSPVISSVYRRCRAFADQNRNWVTRIQYLFAFLFFFAVLWEIQFSTSYLVGSDSFYHVKMAEIILSRGIIDTFPWLQFTTLHESYVNQHFLFHVLLIPFVEGLGRFYGPKLFIVLLQSLSFLGGYFLLKRHNIRFSFFWILCLFAAPPDFLFRQQMIRAPTLALVFLVGGLICLLEERPGWLFLLSFLFAWVYGGFFFLPIMVGIYFLVCFITQTSGMNNSFLDTNHNFLMRGVKYIQQWQNQYNLPWILLFSCLGGVLLGLLTHPYFPDIFSYLYSQIFQTGLGHSIQVGDEWYSYDAIDFLFMSRFILGLLFLGFCSVMIQRVEQKVPVLVLFMMTCLFLALTMKSKRFVEYWPFFGVLLAAFLCNNILSTNMIKNWWPVGIILIGGLLWYSSQNVQRTKQKIQPFWNVESSREAIEHLKQHADQGEVVFTDNWDVFTIFFFFNHKTYYIVGLDPTFMQLYSSELYNEYREITKGKRQQKLYEAIGGRFRADYVMVDVDHSEFEYNLQQSPDHFDLMFQNDHWSIYRVKP